MSTLAVWQPACSRETHIGREFALSCRMHARAGTSAGQRFRSLVLPCRKQQPLTDGRNGDEAGTRWPDRSWLLERPSRALPARNGQSTSAIKTVAPPVAHEPMSATVACPSGDDIDPCRSSWLSNHSSAIR